MRRAKDLLAGVRGAALPYAIAAAGVVVGLLLAFVVPAVAGDAWGKEAKAAESVASGFVTACYTIDTTDVEATAAALEGLVTDNFTTTCLDLMAPSEQEKAALAETQVQFDNVVVRSVGTMRSDDDSADVVVAFNFTGTAPSSTAPAPLSTRGIVHLVKTDGEWLVDDFSEIFPPEATIDEAGDPTPPNPEEAPQ